MENHYIRNIKYLRDAAGNVPAFCITTNLYDNDDEVQNITVSRIDSTTPSSGGTDLHWTENINALSKMWSKDVKSDSNLASWSHYSSSKNALLQDNKIYVIGTTYTVKDPAPSSGGYWHSGLVSCLDISGNILWKKEINLSNKVEQLKKAIIHNNHLYIVGEHSRLRYDNTKYDFGNGLLVKMSLNGSVVYSKTFGDKNTWSAFNSLEKMDNLYIYGFSNAKEKDQFQKWFVEVGL